MLLLLRSHRIAIACCLLASAMHSSLAQNTPFPTVSPAPTMSANGGGTTPEPTIGVQTLPPPPNPTNRPTEEETDPSTLAPVPPPISVVDTPSPVASTPPPVADTPSPVASTPSPSQSLVTSPPPTDAVPTPEPTFRSTSNSPTPLPTPKPTNQPTPLPTRLPTNEPTTPLPTEEPTPVPTPSPQEFPTTKRPSSSPTRKPTADPTAEPTAPSITETRSPTVPGMTPEPTVSFSTESPIPPLMSESPSAPVLSESPTASPKSTRPTTKLLGPTSVTNLKITLTGIDKVPNTNQWARATASFFQDWYNRSSKDPLSVQYNIYDADVKVYFESETAGLRRLLTSLMRGTGRKLQTSATVEVTYTQTTMYRTRDSPVDIYQIVEAPLENQTERDEYVKALKYLDGYAGLTDVSPISLPGPDDGDKIVDGSEDSGGLSTGAIIGIACGSAAAAVLLGGLIFIRTKSDKDSESGDRGTSTQSATISSNPQISSKFEPTFGDQSVLTVDYDYSKAYGGAGNYSLSDAGGTLGSRTRLTAADAALVPGSAGTIFSDDNTFDQAYEGVREELLDIYAPSGKLGVVIDTPNDGPPVVHAVKDTSPIADKVRVGDKLVAVDDEDVRDMTAIKVSKLISRKSTNASRKLTVIRTVAE